MISTKSKTLTIGGGLGATSFQRDTVEQVITEWSRDHLHSELRRISEEITQQQVDLGNKPTSVMVDNSNFKQIDQATKRVHINFGWFLGGAVISAIEEILFQMISGSTNKVTGKLRDISNWEWVFVPGGKRGEARVIRDPTTLGALALDDRLILRPKLAYATAVNQSVASARNLAAAIKSGRWTHSAIKRGIPEKVGFLGGSARMMRRNTLIKQSFSVYATFTRKFLADGEVATAGKGGPLHTGQIVLRPKKRGRS